MNETLFNTLQHIVGNECILQNESMSRHCTFRAGGRADLYVTPDTREKLKKVILECKKLDTPFLIIGNGSNLLVRDEGYHGVIIELDTKFSNIELKEGIIEAEAGAKLSKTALFAMENGLTNFEFAHGIPGNIGGAVTMNAGAYDGEMKQVLQWVEVMDFNGEIKVISADKLQLGYRTSIILKEKLIVLKAGIKLENSDKEVILQKMNQLMAQRKEKQPLEYPSAGSTFKRPEGYFAGKLIQDAGLKGYSVGGAKVSEKHSGFVINYNNATATDIINLLNYIKSKVYEQFKVELEAEVKII